MKSDDPSSRSSAQSHYEEFLVRFKAFTDDELIDAFNREVGNPGWVSARASYLAALQREFQDRGFDYAAIGDERSLSLRRRVRLVDKTLEPLDGA